MFMKSIYFVIEYSMAHPNQWAVAKLWMKKGFNKVFFCGRSTKGATRDNPLNFKFPFLHKFSMLYRNFNLSLKMYQVIFLQFFSLFITYYREFQQIWSKSIKNLIFKGLQNPPKKRLVLWQNLSWFLETLFLRSFMLKPTKRA